MGFKKRRGKEREENMLPIIEEKPIQERVVDHIKYALYNISRFIDSGA